MDEIQLPWGQLSVPLLRHQRQAVSWMKSREEATQSCGGLLADDQVGACVYSGSQATLSQPLSLGSRPANGHATPATLPHTERNELPGLTTEVPLR